MVTVEDVKLEFEVYHTTNFGTPASELPKLDLLVVYGAQHAEVVLGRRSAPLAMLVLHILRRQAKAKSLTIMLSVPYTGNDDFAEVGFVRHQNRWVAVC